MSDFPNSGIFVNKIWACDTQIYIFYWHYKTYIAMLPYCNYTKNLNKYIIIGQWHFRLCQMSDFPNSGIFVDTIWACNTQMRIF